MQAHRAKRTSLTAERRSTAGAMQHQQAGSGTVKPAQPHPGKRCRGLSQQLLGFLQVFTWRHNGPGEEETVARKETRPNSWNNWNRSVLAQPF